MLDTPAALNLVERVAVSLSGGIDVSADRLAAGVRLRQAAWGPAGDPLPLDRAAALAQGLPEGIVVDLSALPDGTIFSAALGRVMLNVLLLAADSLPRGGQVVLAGAADDVFVQVAGAEAAWPAGLGACLVNEAQAATALTEGPSLQMALTALLARAAGIRVSTLVPPNRQSGPAILRLGG